MSAKMVIQTKQTIQQPIALDVLIRRDLAGPEFGRRSKLKPFLPENATLLERKWTLEACVLCPPFFVLDGLIVTNHSKDLNTAQYTQYLCREGFDSRFDAWYFPNRSSTYISRGAIA